MVQIPISIGEAVDKITILRIKKEKIPNAAAKINEEINFIIQRIEEFNVEVKYFIDLQDVNQKVYRRSYKN